MYGKTTILFTSDERNICYRKAIQAMVESLGFHFIDLDSLIGTIISNYAETIPNGSRLLNNNMLIFQVEKEMEWNTDYIVGDTVYEPEERTVTFQSQKFAPIAMLQSRCTDYPYRHWEFRCTND